MKKFQYLFNNTNYDRKSAEYDKIRTYIFSDF